MNELAILGLFACLCRKASFPTLCIVSVSLRIGADRPEQTVDPDQLMQNVVYDESTKFDLLLIQQFLVELFQFKENMARS